MPKKYRCPGYHSCQNPDCENECVQRKHRSAKNAANERWTRVNQNPRRNGRIGQKGLREKFVKQVRREAAQQGIRLGEARIEQLAKKRYDIHMEKVREARRVSA